MTLQNQAKRIAKNYLRRKKAQAEIADTIAIITIILIVVVYSLTIGNKIFKTIEAVVTSANPRMQAIELSSLFTISAAAPENSKITYNFFKYDVNVSGNKDDRYLSIENQKLKKYTKPSYSSYFAPPFPSFELKNTKSIEFGKFIEDNEVVNLFVDGETNSYDISSYISSSNEEKYIPLEKYIVCAYKTCEEGYENIYCPSAGITETYNSLVDKVNDVIKKYAAPFFNYFGLSSFDGYEKRCGGSDSYGSVGINEYTDQFPLEINVKKDDSVSAEDLKKEFGLSDFCINSHDHNPAVFMFSTSGLFEFDTGYCDNEVDVKKDGKVYLWVYHDTGLDKRTIYVDESKPYVDLNSENGYKELIKYSGSHPTLRRIHYKDNDYIMVFCARYSDSNPCTSFTNYVNGVESGSVNDVAYFIFCDVTHQLCYSEFGNYLMWLGKGNSKTIFNVKITYDGILSDAYGKYMQFTIEGV